MNFLIWISPFPQNTTAVKTAYYFAKAALAEGHSIQHVFFSHEGVWNTLENSARTSDGQDITTLWAQLAKQAHFPLLVCQAACDTRGLKTCEEEGDGRSLHASFQAAGLGQFFGALLKTDRLMTFK